MINNDRLLRAGEAFQKSLRETAILNEEAWLIELRAVQTLIGEGTDDDYNE